MEMQTDNASLPYSDPTATPNSGLSPESLALSGASDAGDVSRVRAILSSLDEDVVLPLSPAQFLGRARFRSATNDLQDACKTGHVEQARRVLQAWRGDPSLKDPTPEDVGMALVLAAKNARGEIVRFLLSEGVPVGSTAPKLAGRKGDGAVEVFQAFFDHGWDVNSFERIPAIHSSTVSLSLTKWFLDNGADPNLISKDGHTPLDFAVTQLVPETESIIDLLISSGALFTRSNALHNALITIQHDADCIRIMGLLLKRGVDINALSFSNRPDFASWNPGTALHWAVKKHCARRQRKNMLARVKWLLDHGADVKVKNARGETAEEGATDEALKALLSLDGE